jgi:predicted MFS family arabinose efflux permease
VVLPFLAGYYLSYVFRAVNAVLGPTLAAEFSLNATELGFLTGVYFFSFGLFQIPLGLLLDRFGPRRTNGALLVLAAAGGLAFAYAHSFETLVLARALIGLGVSACLMGTIQAFVLWFPPERTGTMIALAYSMGGLGAITASAPLEAALGHFTWREIFVFLSACTLTLAALMAFWVPERRLQAKVAPLAGLREILRDGAFWRVAIAIGTNQCAVVSLFTLWITAWLRDVAGYDRGAAAAALAWVAVALIAGYFFFGRLGDMRARRGRSQLPLFAAGVAASVLALILLAAGVTAGATFIWAAFVFFGTGATLAHSIATRRFPREMAGRVNTALNTFTFFGIFIGQWATGAVLNQFPPSSVGGEAGYDPRGYAYAFGALALVQAAGLAWLWRGRRLLTR